MRTYFVTRLFMWSDPEVDFKSTKTFKYRNYLTSFKSINESKNLNSTHEVTKPKKSFFDYELRLVFVLNYIDKVDLTKISIIHTKIN